MGAKITSPGHEPPPPSWSGSTGPSVSARCGSADPPDEPGDDGGRREDEPYLSAHGGPPMTRLK
jgi:hypothetical protein